MKLPFFRNRERAPKPRKSALREWLDAIVFAVIVATLVRGLFVEAFAIPTSSMEHSLLVGDHLFVSKVHYGARLTRTPLQIPLTHQTLPGTTIPSYLDWVQLPYLRLPGFTKIHNNEPVVFNYPPETQHPTDLKTYYIKRCVGLAGDTLHIVDQQIRINGKPLPQPPGRQTSYFLRTDQTIDARVFYRYGITDVYPVQDGYWLHTTQTIADELKQTDAFRSLTEVRYARGQANNRAYPQNNQFNWNEDNYGPLYIPKKGDQIPVTNKNLALYGELITRFEGNENVRRENGKLSINGQELTSYTFKQDYYFMMGDNRHNSLDSRFWGFVPDDHIVGKPMFVWWSVNANESWLNPLAKIRWRKIGEGIE